MVKQELIQEIRARLNNNDSLENIRISLLTSGYSLKDINEALGELSKQVTEKPVVRKELKESKLSSIRVIQSSKIDLIILIILLILFISSIILHYKVGLSLEECKNKVGKVTTLGIISILGIVIKEGTECDTLNINLLLLKFGIFLMILGILYSIYSLFKKP